MATFSLEAWLPTQQARVEQLLASHMADLARRTPPRLAEAMQYSLLAGGKRLRPILCLAFADATAQASRGGGPMGDDAAFALECVHTYSLIHDNLPAMDDDDLRRGRPTNHKVFGEAMAILAGDALLTEAFGALGRGAGGEPAVRARLVAELATGAGAGGMVGGQVLDIAPDRPAEEAYLTRLHRMKTGALIRAACTMGVIAARGDDRALAAAESYGDAVGLGFQIADDLLDVSSSREVMGKPVAADAAAGRHTYPAVIGLAKARALADAQARVAAEAARLLEPEPGPLAALARYAVERQALKKERLDVLLVERGLAESRTKAQALILAGQVVVGDQRVDKPGVRVPVEAELRLKGEVLKYVSRGGLKLEGALDTLKLDVNGQVAADIGASTGGFTDCLLQRGVVRVHAIDVGYGQLHEKLRTDPRVISRERVNARHLTDEELPEEVGVVVIDVSFISLRLVLPPVVRRLAAGGLLVALVKPQFEVGPQHIAKGGVVRDVEARRACIEGMRQFVKELGLLELGLLDSPIAGPAGNVEALLAARKPTRG